MGYIWKMIQPVKSIFLVLILIQVFVFQLVAQSVPENPEAWEFSSTLKYLSSETFHGREAGTDDAREVAELLADSLRAYGLQPSGDMILTHAGYFEPFELFRYESDSVALSFFHGKDTLRLISSIDYQAVSFLKDVSANAGIAFAGYGLEDQETGIINYNNKDLEGKIVLLLDGFPGCRDTLSNSWKKYKRFNDQDDSLLLAKLDHSAAAGAVAAVLITKDTISLESYRDADYFVRPEPPEAKIPLFRLYLDGSRKLTAFLGRDLPSYEKNAAENPATPIPVIDNCGAEMSSKSHTSKLEAYNVLGKIKGKDTTRSIVIGAHYDHLGRRGDTIYYGADDNASGTAGVLSLAKNWAKSRILPSYNLVFAFWSAEEKGMLGSIYHVHHAKLNDTNTVACLNFDMISRKDATDSTQVSVGLLSGSDGIARMAREENDRLAQPFHLDVWYTSGHGGSDYVAFAKRKIPVMSFFSGFHDDYHTPRDVYKKTDPYRMRMILQLGNQCLIRLALPVE
jgi:hypothetical protein